MDTFRREPRRPFYADERNEFRRIRPHAPQFHPRQRFESYDAPYLEEVPPGPFRPRRRMPMPQYYEEESTSHLDNYRSYQSSEPDSGPKPLLPPETIEKLRANLNMINQQLNRYEKQNENQYVRYENRIRDRYDDRYEARNEDRYHARYDDRYPERYDDRYEDRYDDQHEDRYEEVYARNTDRHEPRQGPSSVGREVIDSNEIVQEEEVTKKTIEEIIMVAQALREKLEHREEVAQMQENRGKIEFYDEAAEPIKKEGRRPPLLKTPIILPNTSHQGAIAPPDPPKSTEIAKKSTSTTTKIPSLLTLKTKIPSLLEIHVEPPPEVEYIQENVEPYNPYFETRSRDICWNCNKIGHRHEVCWFPPKEFCFRCGMLGYNDETCPNCP